MAPFLTDWRKRWTGRALAVAQPDDAAGVAAVVGWCAANRAPVVPQGGNTGLAGGAVPDRTGDAVVLSLARLNRIRDIDPINNTITVEAGCILSAVQEAAQAADRLFPLSLAAEGSCTIGGNLSTNAGGTAVLRYGNARELCLGLEVVTATGERWDGLRALRKDNTGYDLRDLFIGAEGTLGVVTAAVMKLYPLPRARIVAWAGLESIDRALTLLSLAQARLGSALTGFELISDVALGLVLEHIPSTRAPLADRTPWNVLIELSAFDGDEQGRWAANAFLEDALEQGLIVDATVAASNAQAAALWALRENVSEAQAAEGRNVKHDIAVPISRIAGFVAEAGAALSTAYPGIRLVTFGHLGDGNLHFNLSPAVGDHGDSLLDRQDAINAITHDLVARYGGSISAEHGLGLLRRNEAARYKAPVEISMMRSIKRALDPEGIMNPGKVLPDE